MGSSSIWFLYYYGYIYIFYRLSYSILLLFLSFYCFFKAFSVAFLKWPFFHDGNLGPAQVFFPFFDQELSLAPVSTSTSAKTDLDPRSFWPSQWSKISSHFKSKQSNCNDLKWSWTVNPKFPKSLTKIEVSLSMNHPRSIIIHRVWSYTFTSRHGTLWMWQWWMGKTSSKIKCSGFDLVFSGICMDLSQTW